MPRGYASGVKIEGTDDLMVKFARTSKRARDWERKVVDKWSEKLVELTRRYAPRDHGDLEKAIDRIPGEEGRYRRRIYFVGVIPERLGRGFQQWQFRYDWYVHEVPHKPGKKTYDKSREIGLPAGGSAYNRIGTKYLERAAKQIDKQMQKDAAARLARELRAAGWN